MDKLQKVFQFLRVFHKIDRFELVINIRNWIDLCHEVYSLIFDNY